MTNHESLPPLLSTYWRYVTATLFLLIPVDMLTTLYASYVYGPSAEANPVMRWALQQGVGAVVGLNIVALALAALIFYGLRELIARSEPPYNHIIGRATEVWLAFLIAGGLFVFANNLLVIVAQVSLVGLFVP